jgi:aconitate hydratase
MVPVGAPSMALPQTLQDFAIAPGMHGRMHSLHALEAAGLGAVSRLPVSLRIVLESMLRSCDGIRVDEDHVRRLAAWRPAAARTHEVPLVVARILLQDFTGVPLLCDLAAMRSAASRLGRDPMVVEPLVPMDLVIDHSVQIDHHGSPADLARNMDLEFQRNAERYRFIKWGMQAFNGLLVVPPGIGIVHQVNLESLAKPIWRRGDVCFPDTVIGTDSHTTMINGLGVVGWGVGGIEAEAAMLGHPLHFLTPDVVGVHLHGALATGVTATDLVLRVTEVLRKAGVVGKFVEFCGAGAASLTVPDRATLGNMAPEYGATIGFFPVDGQTLAYLRATGRREEDVATLEAYLRAQGLFGTPDPAAIDYSEVVDIDLATVVPSIAGPRRPQDRIRLGEVKERFTELLQRLPAEDGYGKPASELERRYRAPDTGPAVQPTTAVPHTGASTGTVARYEVEMVESSQMPIAAVPTRVAAGTGGLELGHGDVLIAAITSCTNTSNPGVMLAAGLLARNAVRRGLAVDPRVKTSLAPGSRVVASYLASTGLLPYLERLGFAIVAYGCTTCIGNSGGLDPRIEEAVQRHDLVCAAVLSGNRNFEARIHPAIRANFLMSPPLVVAFALAGRIGIDLDHEPLGTGADGRPVHLRELWPSAEEVAALLPRAFSPAVYRERYGDVAADSPRWNAVPAPVGEVYAWERSSYIAEPPFFRDFALQPSPPQPIRGARALALFGDSVTTDHISPAGAILPTSPAGLYLQSLGIPPSDFNSYGSRRGNHEVMMRGTFANPRLRNLMLPPREDGSRVVGGFTTVVPGGERLPIYEAAMRHRAAGTPTLIFAGEDYGSGSSRDWAAKGTALLGVRAVVARSFERIHRGNLVGMGVLPLQFQHGERIDSVPIRGDETFALEGLEQGLRPQQEVTLAIARGDGSTARLVLRLRVDTGMEAEHIRHGGILPYALRALLARR